MRHSPAEYARQRAQITTAKRYAAENEVWFDGGVESVDRRLADCRCLLAASQAAIAAQGLGPSTHTHLDRIASLRATEGALIGLRRDLLTAGADREATKPYGPPRESSLSRQDRRYVALESAKFLAAHPGVDPDELVIRARHHAELQTSTYPASRSRAVTAAFIDQVSQLRRVQPRPRTASVPPVVNGPPELIFM